MARPVGYDDEVAAQEAAAKKAIEEGRNGAQATKDERDSLATQAAGTFSTPGPEGSYATLGTLRDGALSESERLARDNALQRAALSNLKVLDYDYASKMGYSEGDRQAILQKLSSNPLTEPFTDHERAILMTLTRKVPVAVRASARSNESRKRLAQLNDEADKASTAYLQDGDGLPAADADDIGEATLVPPADAKLWETDDEDDDDTASQRGEGLLTGDEAEAARKGRGAGDDSDEEDMVGSRRSTTRRRRKDEPDADADDDAGGPPLPPVEPPTDTGGEGEEGPADDAALRAVVESFGNAVGGDRTLPGRYKTPAESAQAMQVLKDAAGGRFDIQLDSRSEDGVVTIKFVEAASPPPIERPTNGPFRTENEGLMNAAVGTYQDIIRMVSGNEDLLLQFGTEMNGASQVYNAAVSAEDKTALEAAVRQLETLAQEVKQVFERQLADDGDLLARIRSLRGTVGLESDDEDRLNEIQGEVEMAHIASGPLLNERMARYREVTNLEAKARREAGAAAPALTEGEERARRIEALSQEYQHVIHDLAELRNEYLRRRFRKDNQEAIDEANRQWSGAATDDEATRSAAVDALKLVRTRVKSHVRRAMASVEDTRHAEGQMTGKVQELERLGGTITPEMRDRIEGAVNYRHKVGWERVLGDLDRLIQEKKDEAAAGATTAETKVANIEDAKDRIKAEIESQIDAQAGSTDVVIRIDVGRYVTTPDRSYHNIIGDWAQEIFDARGVRVLSTGGGGDSSGNATARFRLEAAPSAATGGATAPGPEAGAAAEPDRRAENPALTGRIQSVTEADENALSAADRALFTQTRDRWYNPRERMTQADVDAINRILQQVENNRARPATAGAVPTREATGGAAPRPAGGGGGRGRRPNRRTNTGGGAGEPPRDDGTTPAGGAVPGGDGTDGGTGRRQSAFEAAHAEFMARRTTETGTASREYGPLRARANERRTAVNGLVTELRRVTTRTRDEESLAISEGAQREATSAINVSVESLRNLSAANNALTLAATDDERRRGQALYNTAADEVDEAIAQLNSAGETVASAVREIAERNRTRDSGSEMTDRQDRDKPIGELRADAQDIYQRAGDAIRNAQVTNESTTDRAAKIRLESGIDRLTESRTDLNGVLGKPGMTENDKREVIRAKDRVRDNMNALVILEEAARNVQPDVLKGASKVVTDAYEKCLDKLARGKRLSVKDYGPIIRDRAVFKLLSEQIASQRTMVDALQGMNQWDATKTPYENFQNVMKWAKGTMGAVGIGLLLLAVISGGAALAAFAPVIAAGGIHGSAGALGKMGKL